MPWYVLWKMRDAETGMIRERNMGAFEINEAHQAMALANSPDWPHVISGRIVDEHGMDYEEPADAPEAAP